MKKRVITLAVLLLSFAVFGGCAENTEQSEEQMPLSEQIVTTETAQTEETAETAAETSVAGKITVEAAEAAVTQREYAEGEEMLIAFLSYLQNGTAVCSPETEAETTYYVPNNYMENEHLLLGFLSYLQKTEPVSGVYYVFDHGNSFDQYDFFYDFKIDGYSYQHRGDGSYNVRLTCSDSTCDLFPNGDSYWYFKPGFFCRYEEKDDIVTNTYETYEKYKDMPNYETISTAFAAACAFPFFEADEEWFKEIRTDISEFDIHNFYHTYNPYLDLTQYADGGVYPDDLRAAIKKLYNITLPENAFDRLRFEEDGRVFAYCGHGGTWGYEALVGYEETESEVKITVNFYGDEMYFYPVVQSEYTFSKNEDGAITLQRVKKNFDRGYTLASGTV